MALTDNLVSYFKMDEASGTRADSHGSNSLADVNTVGAATAKLGTNAAAFVAASSERLEDTSLSGGATNEITVSLWHKGTVFTSSPGLFVFAPASTGTRDDMSLRIGSGFIYPDVRWNAGGEQFLTPSGGVCTGNGDGNYHHYVARWYNDGSRANIDAWYDGVQVTTAQHASLQFVFPTWTKLYVATHFNNFGGTFGPYLTGDIDELAFWSRKVTDAEIGQLYNAGAGLAYPLTVGGTFIPRVSWFM